MNIYNTVLKVLNDGVACIGLNVPAMNLKYYTTSAHIAKTTIENNDELIISAYNVIEQKIDKIEVSNIGRFSFHSVNIDLYITNIINVYKEIQEYGFIAVENHDTIKDIKYIIDKLKMWYDVPSYITYLNNKELAFNCSIIDKLAMIFFRLPSLKDLNNTDYKERSKLIVQSLIQKKLEDELKNIDKEAIDSSIAIDQEEITTIKDFLRTTAADESIFDNLTTSIEIAKNAWPAIFAPSPFK